MKNLQGSGRMNIPSNDIIGRDRDSLKRRLAEFLNDRIVEQKLTQKDAAARIGITQPRLSNIINRKIETFSIDAALVAIMNIGYDIEIKPKKVV